MSIIHRLIELVRREHRETLKGEPRGKREKLRPNTALISTAAFRRDFPFVVYHTLAWHGSSACGQRAFRLRFWPAPGVVMRSTDARHLDGQKVEHGERVLCDTCRQPVPPDTRLLVKYEP